MNYGAVFGNITFLVLLAVVLSVFFPDFGLIFQPYVTYMAMVIIYFSLIKTPVNEVFRSVKPVKNLFFGLILQYLIVGTAGLILAKTFLSNPDLIAGLILISITPTGISNVVFTDAIKGRTALTIAIVLAGTIIAPFIMPLWAVLFIEKYIPVDALSLFLSTAAMIFIPFAAAKITRSGSIKLTGKMIKHSNQIQMAVLFVIIFAFISPAIKYLTDPVNAVVLLVTTGVIITGILAGYLTRFLGADWDLAKTFMVVGARKNTALCFGLMAFFPPAAVFPLVIWSILHNVWIGALQLNQKK